MPSPDDPPQHSAAGPVQTLSLGDAVGIVVGLVIGAGIFKTPSLVAVNTGAEWVMIAVWVAGGVVSVIGALCYAELATAYPHAGGDYHFVGRAFGRDSGTIARASFRSASTPRRSTPRCSWPR